MVRELTSKRVWCAEPVLSRAEQEVHRVIVLARPWAERVAKPVRAWMSDKQDAFVKAIATALPGIPHRDCHNHFVRDVAKPVLDMDRQAKVTMRSTGRGVRAIERRVLAERRPLRHLSRHRHLRRSRAPPRPKPPSLPRLHQPKRLRLSPVQRALGECSLPRAPLRRRVWPQLRNRTSRTRRERWCLGMVRRYAACSTRARVVRFTHPVDGCARLSRMCVTHSLATWERKKGACRVAVDASGQL